MMTMLRTKTTKPRDCTLNPGIQINIKQSALHCKLNTAENVNMYFQKELSQISTIDQSQAKKVFQGNIKEKKIQAFTLDKILELSNVTTKKIDLLDIDVEGADLKVLEGLSFDKFKPELICVEIHDENISESQIFKFLSNLNYKLIWSGVFSHIFKT